MLHRLDVRRTLALSVSIATLLAASSAVAGGNGNGGNGSGGSHGAATSGMTYHSEPVSSPWNRVPGDMPREVNSTDAKARSTSAGTPDMSMAPGE